MAAVFRRYSGRERDDDSGSEVSTLKGSALKSFRSVQSESCRSFGTPRYVNSATCIENEIFKGDSYSSDSDDAIFDDDEQTIKKPPSVTKTCRIDFSPEAELKRKEAFEKWLNSVTLREKERKRVALQRLEAVIEANRSIEASRKIKSEEMVDEWMRKKKIETERKMLRLAEMKKAAAQAANKPKEFKKAINFQDWLHKKNEDNIRLKQEEDEKKKRIEKARNNCRKCRESVSSASYEKWFRSASSKPKPVPLNRGLESLRGSTTKIFINPEPWKFDE